MTVWSPIDFLLVKLFLYKRLEFGAFQGTPDITVDDAKQVSILAESPWGEIDPESHVVETSLGELSNSGSREGILTEGDVLVVRDDCGIIQRCPDCRRVLRDGVCPENDAVVEGVDDLRLRFVIDDGLASANVVVGRAASEKFLEQDMASIQTRINTEGSANFVKEIKNKLFGTRLTINGRAIVDDRGIMLLPDTVVETKEDPVSIASEVRETWGVVL